MGRAVSAVSSIASFALELGAPDRARGGVNDVIRSILGGFVAAGLLASSALAQSASSTWNGLPDRFQIDAGYFRVESDTTLRYNGDQGSGDVNFERDLDVDKNTDTFWIDGTWRVGRRHQLKLGYTRFNRDRRDFPLQRPITWGGQDFSAGLEVSGHTGSDLLGGYYRFAVVRNDRFEIGPALGIGYLWLNAGIRVTASVGGASRDFDITASKGSITGAVGAYASGWAAKRLLIHGDFLYIKVSPGNSEASVTDWRLGADYYFFRNAGLGVQYKYDRFVYDRGLLSTQLGGQVTYQGAQVFLTFRF